MRNRLSVVLPLAAAAIVFSSGCERDDIRTYTVAKDANKSVTTRSAAAASTRQPINVNWSVPPTWKEVPTSEPMRVATFEKGKVQVLVSTFPGDVGGMLANINRWRGQLGLNPTTEPELAETVISEMSEGIRINTTRLSGPNEDMLGAVIETGDGNTWFVKAVATKSEATDMETEFFDFCRSFKLKTSPTEAPKPPTALPANHPPVDASASIPAVQPPLPESGVLARARAATVPETWKIGRDASGIAVLAFDAPDGVRITLTSLRGDGGGALANINRWRGQFGLAPVAELAAQPMRVIAPNTSLVDLEDEPKARRMITAIVSEPETTWFFKLTGTAQGAANHAAAFERFVLDAVTESEAR